MKSSRYRHHTLLPGLLLLSKIIKELLVLCNAAQQDYKDNKDKAFSQEQLDTHPGGTRHVCWHCKAEAF